jgi:speckle-type POZ protein
MISYLYTFDYEENGKGGQSIAGLSNLRVYAIAEKYNIPLLKEIAKEKFVKWAENNWSHCDFPVVAREVYESTRSNDFGLRDVVARLCGGHVKELVRFENEASTSCTHQGVEFSAS